MSILRSPAEATGAGKKRKRCSADDTEASRHRKRLLDKEYQMDRRGRMKAFQEELKSSIPKDYLNAFKDTSDVKLYRAGKPSLMIRQPSIL